MKIVNQLISLEIAFQEAQLPLELLAEAVQTLELVPLQTSVQVTTSSEIALMAVVD